MCVVCLQRMLLWQRRNNTVMPFNETVQQVFARISALRDSLDGPQVREYLFYSNSLYRLDKIVQEWWSIAPGLTCQSLIV